MLLCALPHTRLHPAARYVILWLPLFPQGFPKDHTSPALPVLVCRLHLVFLPNHSPSFLPLQQDDVGKKGPQASRVPQGLQETPFPAGPFSSSSTLSALTPRERPQQAPRGTSAGLSGRICVLEGRTTSYRLRRPVLGLVRNVYRFGRPAPNAHPLPQSQALLREGRRHRQSQRGLPASVHTWDLGGRLRHTPSLHRSVPPDLGSRTIRHDAEKGGPLHTASPHF